MKITASRARRLCLPGTGAEKCTFYLPKNEGVRPDDLSPFSFENYPD